LADSYIKQLSGGGSLAASIPLALKGVMIAALLGSWLLLSSRRGGLRRSGVDISKADAKAGN
jgi:hypothetical protein